MKNVNVLLVEDSEINQLVTSSFLEKNGIGVEIANHGREALSMIAAKKYQLVLMDLQMPEMDGFESTRQIRSMSDPYFKTVPIFAFTSSSMVDTMEKVKQSGMTDFVNKPLMVEDFQWKINKYVVKTPLQKESLRTLSIDFNLYTDGDPKSKWQLIVLMIGNILELIQSLHLAIDQNNPEVFRKVYYKVKPTLSMLADAELMAVMDELKNHSFNKKQEQNIIMIFHRLCESIIKGLEHEQTTIIKKLPEK